MCELHCTVIWVRTCDCCRRNSGEICHSRLSETNSPRRDLQEQTRGFTNSRRWRALVLSEALSRSGESHSPKRGGMKALGRCCGLAQARDLTIRREVVSLRRGRARLSEPARTSQHWSRSRLSEGLPPKREHPSRLSEGSWLEQDPLQVVCFLQLVIGWFDL